MAIDEHWLSYFVGFAVRPCVSGPAEKEISVETNLSLPTFNFT
jgi:hypothetical protein